MTPRARDAGFGSRPSRSPAAWARPCRQEKLLLLLPAACPPAGPAHRLRCCARRGLLGRVVSCEILGPEVLPPKWSDHAGGWRRRPRLLAWHCWQAAAPAATLWLAAADPALPATLAATARPLPQACCSSCGTCPRCRRTRPARSGSACTAALWDTSQRSILGMFGAAGKKRAAAAPAAPAVPGSAAAAAPAPESAAAGPGAGSKGAEAGGDGADQDAGQSQEAAA